MRKIIHIDMDAFYASVEQLDNPDLLGKPVAVGGTRERGVIAAASYEARKFGVKSAMNSQTAVKLCPDLIFVKPNFARYKEISQHIHTIFHRYTDLIEPLALDEAFLDVTVNKLQMNSATFIAQSIKTDIKTELGLVASAGVSYSKFLAKLASDQDKPNGLFVITPEEAQSYVNELPIERFFGVGKVTADRMHELQIYKGKDLKGFSLEQLTQHFGKAGKFLFDICRGIDNRPVVPDRERKSIAAETTLHNDIFDTNGFLDLSERMLQSVWGRYQRFGKLGKSLTLKVKYSDFSVRNRSKTLPEGIKSLDQLKLLADELNVQFTPLEQPIRLLGFQISGFMEGEPEQLRMEL
ncbi:MAG: polymerase [Bacteroidota bacterium]|jgi:DNA polymerase-4